MSVNTNVTEPDVYDDVSLDTREVLRIMARQKELLGEVRIFEEGRTEYNECFVRFMDYYNVGCVLKVDTVGDRPLLRLGVETKPSDVNNVFSKRVAVDNGLMTLTRSGVESFLPALTAFVATGDFDSVAEIIEYTDVHGTHCSLQTSIILSPKAVWFGINRISTSGTYINQRMHLTQCQAEAILPILAHFVTHGTFGRD